MNKLTEDKIMYRMLNGLKKPEAGSRFKFKPTLFQKIFGYNPFVNLMLLEDNHFGHDYIKVIVPKGSIYIETDWGALVSEAIVLA